MEVEQNLPVVEHAISEGVECQPREEKKNILLDLFQTLMVDILKTTLGSGQIGKKCVKIHTLA